MSSKQSGYGAIGSPRRSKSSEERPLVGDSSVHHEGEQQPGRSSRLVMIAVAVAAVIGFVSTRGGFGDDAFNLEMSGASFGHHSRKHLLDHRFDEVNMFFNHQKVDHFDDNNTKEWSQRFLKISKHFKGPGHPIFFIMGGEDILELPVLYPWVNTGLAKEFGAFVMNNEHRFYGESQPVKKASSEDLIAFQSPDQALLDALNLIQATREALGCSFDKTSSDYCPVITFGGSYPGFLSAMMRFRFPDIIDISYAASAPLNLYAQNVNDNDYFDKVTEVADEAVPGCADAVKSTMFAARDELLEQYTSVKHAAKATGFCSHTFPQYMKDIPEFISETITYLVPAVFADFNMAYYPPGPKTALEQACQIFLDTKTDPLQRIHKFYDLRGEVEYGLNDKPECFDLSLELPDGPDPRIRGADTSGTGGGFTGEVWEFQCCKDLIIQASYSEESMFIPRPFSLGWLTEHCTDRFGKYPVDPTRMVRLWGFDDLSNASRILFTNGLRDGWSKSSILESDNPNIAIINLPNGAHHSDLSMVWPNPRDTDDIVQGHEEALAILSQWLDEIKAQAE